MILLLTSILLLSFPIVFLKESALASKTKWNNTCSHPKVSKQNLKPRGWTSAQVVAGLLSEVYVVHVWHFNGDGGPWCTAWSSADVRKGWVVLQGWMLVLNMPTLNEWAPLSGRRDVKLRRVRVGKRSLGNWSTACCFVDLRITAHLLQIWKPHGEHSICTKCFGIRATGTAHSFPSLANLLGSE